MVRNAAREIAIHLSYELSFTDKAVEELLDQRLTAASFASLAEEDDLFRQERVVRDALERLGEKGGIVLAVDGLECCKPVMTMFSAG